MCFKAVWIMVIGIPTIVVLLFEVMLSAMAIFNHSNISLPRRLEPWVRLFFVTPDMHRIHHSVRIVETNSNYGFTLSIWDRLFKTYRLKYLKYLHIGLHEYQDVKSAHQLWDMLKMPFPRYSMFYI
jgi:sterol desaturase/sphingolipid hydroxylase (fatty acid hydroxylase superfamily)